MFKLLMLFRYLSSRGVRSHWLNNTVIPAFEQVSQTFSKVFQQAHRKPPSFL